MFDTFLWLSGAITWLGLIYFFLLGHIVKGLTEACQGCWWLIRADLRDPEQCRQEIASHYNEWDKLWMVPEVFINRFIKATKRSWDWR